jgi:hypothetical protein
MRNQKEFSLKLFSVVHNIIMILLSFAMFIGIIFSALRRYNDMGYFKGLFCYDDNNQVSALDGEIGYWVYLFYLRY